MSGLWAFNEAESKFNYGHTAGYEKAGFQKADYFTEIGTDGTGVKRYFNGYGRIRMEHQAILQEMARLERKNFKEFCTLEKNSNSGIDLSTKKNKSKKERRSKPKRKDEFRVGKIRKWNDFFIGRGYSMGFEKELTDQVEASFWNRGSEWKVYSRRSKRKKK